jgi:hypothetical protein
MGFLSSLNPANWSVGGNSLGGTSIGGSNVGQYLDPASSTMRNATETGATLVADYYTGGLASLGNGWQSKGSQGQLGSTLGEVGQVGAGLAGAGVGSSTTGIPASPLVTGAEAYLGLGGTGMSTGGGSVDYSSAYGGGDMASLGMTPYSGASTDLSTNDWFAQQAMQGTAQGSGQYGAGIGMGTSTGGGLPAAGAGGGAAAGGMQGLLKGALPYAGAANIVGGLYGLYSAGKAGQQANQYGSQIAALEANPNSIQNAPGYQAGLNTIRNTDASTGYGHSGKEQVDLLNYGSTAYNQQIQTLSQLQAQAQQGTATATGSIGGIGMGIGMMAAGGSFDKLLSYF